MDLIPFPAAPLNFCLWPRWAPVMIALSLTFCCAPHPPAPRPVILITVDALRADHLGPYHRTFLPTPAFDRLAAEGAKVQEALSPIGRTSQGIGTILTGHHPLVHGADGLGMALPDKLPTLAEAFQAAGYKTGAFVTNLFLRPGLGFERGFELYSNPRQRWEGDSSSALASEALAWIEAAHREQKPFFLWIHFLDPHWTYQPPPPWAQRADPEWRGETRFERFREGDAPINGKTIFGADRELPAHEVEHIRRLYAGEVAATDQALGQFLAGLDRLGLTGQAILALTADHGESLGEHRYWFAHGEYIYQESLHVPLLIRAPGLVPEKTEITGPVSTESVPATLADLAGLSHWSRTAGINLGPVLRRGGTQAAPAAPVIHLTDHLLVHPENPRRPVIGRPGRWWAIRQERWKLIRIPSGNGQFMEELYDLSADGNEMVNRLADYPDIAAQLRDTLLERQRFLLARWQQSGAAEPAVSVPETMRGLGYIQ